MSPVCNCRKYLIESFSYNTTIWRMGTEFSSFHFHHPEQVDLSFFTKHHLKSSEYSDSTVASSCSLPMISNISTTPPSVSSPKKSLPGNELDAQQLPWTFDVRFRHPKSAIELPHHKSLRNGSSSKSIDLEEEWKKVSEEYNHILLGYLEVTNSQTIRKLEYYKERSLLRIISNGLQT